jgi:hypothetical protein
VGPSQSVAIVRGLEYRRRLAEPRLDDAPGADEAAGLCGRLRTAGPDVRRATVRRSPRATARPQRRALVNVTLLDLDPAALEYATAQLSPCLPPEHLQTVAANLFRLPQRPQLASQLADVDLLLCPGIFDYLDDVAAAQMLRYFWQRLAPGGRVTVFQFAPHNPSRALMEWIGNWYLIYRDEGQLRAVAAAAGIPAEATAFGVEPQGVDLFVTAVRT